MKIPFKGVERLKRRKINISNVKKGSIIIYANRMHRITEEEIKAIKNDLLTPKGLLMGKLNKLYKITLMFNLNKILTLKGILVRMGKGKGKIKTKAQYLTVGTRCIILNKITTEPENKKLIEKWIKKLTSKYTYLSYKSPCQ